MICFTWWGLTQYAARAIEAFNQATDESVVVVATRPRSSPVTGMEQVLTCPLIWVEETDTDVLTRLPEAPRILMVSNWNLPCWKGLMAATRATGGKVVAMVDTNYVFSVKAVLRALRFRLLYRRRFDAFMVVGASGRRLMCLWGVSNNLVYDGLYGADVSLFHDGPELPERPRRILYVGQFIERKNVLRLVEAFGRFRERHPSWALEMCGHGPLHDRIPEVPGLIVHDFVQPAELAGLYRQARAFVLPSLEEHWGVVVHEAALSGCFLLLSRNVGASADFAAEHNAALFNPFSLASMEDAFEMLVTFSDNQLREAQRVSCEKAAAFGLSRFVSEMSRLAKTNRK